MRGDLTPERWRRISSLLDEALDLPPDRRPAFLATACGNDDDLRRRVEALLSADERPASFLDRPAAAGAEALLESLDEGGPSPSEAGRIIGPWRLIREIGRGGMGVVWLVERADGQFDQKAALKILRRGVDTDDVVARFLRERQILAGLRHPNIARLLDGGATEDGLPYLVMEHVDGEPITAWCDARRTPLEGRLRLFGAVCGAVQYAHRSLIIHRDLKPSNILVTAGGEAALLDFGIARLIGDDPQDPATTLTQPQRRVLTPQYASPEQVTGRPSTTTTDVYSLGLILYELLSGRRPYHVRSNSVDEISQVVAGAPPPPPSRALTHPVEGSSGPSPEAVAGARSTTVERLRRRLSGDLDTIVLKALRKEPDERYQSVEALVEDLDRFRTGLPIRARPAGRLYRLRKLVTRHRLASGTVAAGLIVFVAWGATLSVSLRQQRLERERAETAARQARTISEFLGGMLSAAGPTRFTEGFRPAGSVDPDLKVRQALDQAAGDVKSRFENDPAVRAGIEHAIGEAYLSLGLYESAEEHLRAAVELRERLDDRSALVASLGRLAATLEKDGRFALALEVGARARALQREISGPAGRDYALLLQSEANSLMRLDRHAEAVAHLEEAWKALDRSGPEAEGARVEVQYALGNARAGLGAPHEEVEALFTDALRRARVHYGADHPWTFDIIGALAVHNSRQGKYAEAESLHREVLVNRRRVYGAEHPYVASALNNIAVAVRNQGRLEDAEPLFREALAIREKVLGEDHFDSLVSRTGLANLLTKKGQCAEAGEAHRAVLAARKRLLGDDHSLTASSLQGVAEALACLKRYGEAEPFLKDALAIRLRVLGGSHQDVARNREALAKLYEAWGRPERAAAVRAGRTP